MNNQVKVRARVRVRVMVEKAGRGKADRGGVGRVRVMGRKG